MFLFTYIILVLVMVLVMALVMVMVMDIVLVMVIVLVLVMDMVLVLVMVMVMAMVMDLEVVMALVMVVAMVLEVVNMERKIGDIFEFHGKKIKVFKSSKSCAECDIFHHEDFGNCTKMRSILGECTNSKRTDKNYVCFKLVEEKK